LAGPVVAAAVILPRHCDHSLFRDSKVLRPRTRSTLLAKLEELGAAIGIGIVSASDIDSSNILQASLLAMRRAVHNLGPILPDHLLVDGKFPVPIDLSQQTLVKGESKSASIAAASIVAKVSRDRIMEELHEQFPHYNFSQHKGYPTMAHRLAIARFGPSPVHRKSFKGVREYGQ
jgi:ribonuclease HII